LLKRYLLDLKVNALPTSLAEYLKTVVTPTLEKQKREWRRLAIKFEAAYLRKLDFDDSDETTAGQFTRATSKVAKHPPVITKRSRIFLFRYIAGEAGRLGMAVHIHAIDGAGSYYRPSGSNPLLLEPVFNDPSLRKTNFVIIHGGAAIYETARPRCWASQTSTPIFRTNLLPLPAGVKRSVALLA